jgi:hypothetical protein
MTQGAPGLDFAIVPGGTCKVGATYNAGQSCTVNVTFTATAAGLRNGGIVVQDVSGNLQAQAYVHGTGTGPQMIFLGEPYYGDGGAFFGNYPESDTLLGGGFSHPGATVDGAGNVFIADLGNGAIKEIPAGCTQDSCQKVVISGVVPWAVAVDGVGNLFVVNVGPDLVFEIPVGCQSGSCLQTIGSGFNQAYGVSVDSVGNVFVADQGNGAIKEVLAAGGYTTVKTLVTGLDAPWSVVVDSNENLFVAGGGDQCQVWIPGSCNTINTYVEEISAANNYSQINVLGAGNFGKPLGLAIDGNGNVFEADFGSPCSDEFLSGSGYTTSSRLCSTGIIGDPESLGVEGNSVLIFPNVISGGVERVDYTEPSTLNFRSPASVGHVDNADGEQAFGVQNQGNAPLTFTSIISTNPSFQIDPATSTCTVAKPLAPGGLCYVNVFFEPTTTGIQTGTITLTDNNLSQNAATQQVPITADSLAPAPTILTEPANPTGVNSATFTFSDTQAGVTFECSIDGLPFSACPSGIIYSPVSVGQHSFEVKALDADNFLSPAAVYNWTVTGVAVAPPTITSGPGHLTSATTAAFSFADTENGVTFLCSLDGVAFTGCTSGVSYTGLAPGPKSISATHTFAVEAELGGNISQPTSYTFAVTGDTVDAVSTDFNAVPVGQTSAPLTVTFTFNAFLLIPAGGDSIAKIDATLLGITGLDYAVSNPGTCAVGTAITAASTCSMQVTFTPQHAGQRKGAIVLLDPAGNGIGEAYLNGTGTAPQVTFTPYTPVNFTILPPQNNANPGKDLQTTATDSTSDGAGDLYVTDALITSVDGTVNQSVGDVWQFPAGCTTAACIKHIGVAGLDVTSGIALDGAGTIFDGNFELGFGDLSTVGNWTPSDCQFIESYVGTQHRPAVDGWGGVYYIGGGILTFCGQQVGLPGTAAVPVKGHLRKLNATKAKPEGGGNTGSFDFSGTANSLTVDPQGNIWVADAGNNAVKEVLASSGYAISQSVGSGFNNPASVASDAFGNIFVADAGHGLIKEMTAQSGYATILTVGTMNQNAAEVILNLSVDALGNVYVPNQTPSGVLGVTEKLDFADAPALTFATPTKVATQDTTDGTLTATVNNSGNAPLTISGLAIAGNGFQIDSNATTCSALTTLAVGGSCTVGVFYSPTAVGAQTGTLTITDNALNANGATQTFALSGTGFINPTTSTPTVTVTPAANTINTTQTLTVTVTVAGKNPTPVPTGVVTLSSGNYNSAAVTLTGGTATVTVPAGALAPSSDQLTAIYAPDQAASTTYNDGAGFATVTVTSATRTTPTVTVTPSPATVTIAQDFSVTVTVAGGANSPTPTGTVTLLSGGFSSGLVVLSNGTGTIPVPARTLAAGTDTLTVNYAPDTASAANYNNAAGSATEIVLPIAKTSPALIVTPSPNQVLTTQALTVTVALHGGIGNPSPTGTVTLSGGGFTSAAITLNGGSAAIPIPAGALSMGTDTLTANYTPDVAGGETYTNATGASTVTVNAAGTSTGNFGTIPVGQTSAAQTLTFTFAGPGTIGSLAAMMQGAPALDFAVVNVGTCTAGATFSAGSTCTANVTFSPILPGTRYGAVIVKDGVGNTVATDLVNGIGSGPQARLVPRFPRVNPAWPTVGAIPAASTVPSGVVDGIGDVFFLEGSQQATVSVMEIPAGCTAAACVKTLPTNATIPGEPFSLALDLSGNIFVTAGTGNVGQIGAIWEITAASGYQTTTKLPVTFGEGDLTGIALDQSGNIFVAISSSLQNAALGLYEVSAAGGYSTATPIASTLTNPYALAIDMSGNLFVSGGTATSTGVYEVLASGGYTTVNLLGNGFSYPGAGEFTLPLQLSTDQGGDVFFIDGATFNSVDEILASGGYQTVDSIPSAFSGSSIDPDASGNFYLFVGNTIDKLEFNDAYVSFGVPTLEGTTDTTDAPHWVTVQNIGNAPLNLTAITPPNANFIIDNSTTTCSISTPIAAGGSCVVGMDFVPTAVGALTGTLTLTDNSLNVNGATQPMYLSGTGKGAPTVTVTPSPASISTAQALTVTVTVSGTPTPTGSVTLTSGTYSSGAVTLSNGSANITVPAGSLATGSDSLTGTYTPDAASASTYTSATGTNTETVTTVSNGGPLTALPANVNFGTVNVGATSAATAVTFTFPSGVTLSKFAALTQGVANLDFSIQANGTTCAAGAQAAGCTVALTFSPLYPGPRKGALVLYDNSSPANAVATVYLTGIGQGPLFAIVPGVMTTVAGNGTAATSGDNGQATSASLVPAFMALDGAGDIFVQDSSSTSALIRRIDATSGVISTIGGGGGGCANQTDSLGDGCKATQASFSIDTSPGQGPTFDYDNTVILDGAGNLYTTDLLPFASAPSGYTWIIRKIDAATGIVSNVLPQGSSIPLCTGGGGLNPTVSNGTCFLEIAAVDGTGTLYLNQIESTGQTNLLALSTQSSTLATLVTNYAYSCIGTVVCTGGGSIDGLGNLFMADHEGNVQKISLSTGTLTAWSGPNLGCDDEYVGPVLRMDAAGDGYFAPSASLGSLNQQVVCEAGPTAQSAVYYAGTDNYPWPFNGDNLAATQANLNNIGDIELDGQGNLYISDAGNNRIRKDTVSTGVPVVFPSTTKGATSVPIDVTIQNIGNAALSLSSIVVSPQFTISSSGTTCTAQGPSIAPGTTCILAIAFAPTTTGAVSGTITFGDNSLNTQSTSKILLTGTATGGSAAAPTVIVTPNSATITTAQALSVTITVGGTPTPTGTITLASGGYTSAAVTLSNGSATISVPAGSLGTGTDTLTATYTPDSTSSTTYNSATGTNTVTVTAAVAKTATALMASATNPTTGTSVTFTATVTQNPGSGVPTGTVTFMDGSTTLGTGTLNGSGVATYTTSSLPLGANSITAVYGGDINNAGSTSPAVTVTVTAVQVLSATLTPATLTFTGVVGTTSAAQIATLTNTGNTALSITGVTLTGTSPGSFAESNTCASSLAPQQTCTISVTFTPASMGSLTAMLSVADNATGGPQTATLNGTATPAPSFTISSPTGPQSISAGASATYTITVTPQNGSFNNAVTFTATGLPPGATAAFQPASITPGGSAANSTLTIQTTSTQTTAAKVGWPLAAPALAALGWLFFPGKRRRRWITSAALLLTSFGAVSAVSACGGGFAIPKAPTETYTVTVTATSGTIQQTTTVQLTVQ